MPVILPVASGTPKPGKPSLTPHWIKPFFWIASRVTPAWALPARPTTAAAMKAVKVVLRLLMRGTPCRFLLFGAAQPAPVYSVAAQYRRLYAPVTNDL